MLLVEDDAGAAGVRGPRPAGAAASTVTTAADGATALAAAGPGPDTRFAAVVLDIGLPDSDGRDVCQALRARGIDVPVLFLTARDQLHDVLAGFAAGGDDHLAKPFHLSELRGPAAGAWSAADAARPARGADRPAARPGRARG